MKNSISSIFIIALALLFLNIQNTFSQSYDYAEFLIVNNTGNDEGFPIAVDVYPFGAIFNGDNTGGYTGQYTPVAAYQVNAQHPYNFGEHQFALSNQTSQTWYAMINFDKSPNYQGCHFSLGYGKYRIDFYVNSTKTFTCDVDFSDANYTGISQTGYCQQFLIEYRDNGTVWAKFNDPNASYYQIENNGSFEIWKQLGTNNGEQPQSRGNFTDSQDPNSIYHSFPLDATNFGFFKHDNPENFQLNLRLKNYSSNIKTDNSLWFGNSIFIIEDGMIFTINSNSQIPPLTFYGESAEFITGNGSEIICPPENYICLVNNAKMTLTGSIFYTTSDYWGGIYMEYPGRVIVDGCNFTNAGYALGCIGNGNYDFKVTNNTFRTNYPLASEHIHLHKCFNANISNNHFYLYNNYGKAIFIYNPTNSESDNNIINSNSNVIITGNDFHNGSDHIWVTGLSTSILSVYIKDNIFYGGLYNIDLRNSVGSLINNQIIEPLTNISTPNINISYSSLDILGNNIHGFFNNFYMGDQSFPNFAPEFISDDQIIWIAGKNTIESIQANNIYTPPIPVTTFYKTDFGMNNFIINNYSSSFMYGVITIDDPQNLTTYYSRGNCWYGGVPLQFLLVNQYGDPVTVIRQSQPPYSGCNSWDYQVIDRIISDKGNEIKDTILIAQLNNFPPQSEEVKLFGIGVKNQKLKNYGTAISNLKNLINNYPNSKHLERVIFNLYECYVALDTNHNQGWRNIIFGDLKNYLESKIQQYDTNEAFINVAFNFLLKCKVKIKSYQPAMDGYQFIAENSPSATERLMASISYIDLEGLLPGGSGGQNNNQDYEDELSSDRNGKPIKEILLASYNKTKESKTKRENLDLQNSNDADRTKAQQNKKHKEDKVIENRALENISISSSLNKKERMDRIQKDLMLLTQRGENTETFVKKNNIEPLNYELSQNYPNPFNPITNIKYQIQKAEFVTLKIYDITGREIKTLVNEIKNPGSYIVTFNGSELASGVYFYRIQSGDFVQVKKMLMIK